jgi:hypothetical protein
MTVPLGACGKLSECRSQSIADQCTHQYDVLSTVLLKDNVDITTVGPIPYCGDCDS